MISFKMAASSMGLVLVAALTGSSTADPCSECAGNARKIVAHLDQGKMTLAKAIADAEKHSKGRALSVISELNDAGKTSIQVYCLAGDAIMKCSVDGAAGGVVGMKQVHALPIAEHAGAHAEARAAATPGATGTLTDQLVEAGCGKCIYSMSGVKGCKLAVKIDGKSYLVTGADHINAHKFCSAAKMATVSGKIEGDKFVSTKFEVQQ